MNYHIGRLGLSFVNYCNDARSNKHQIQYNTPSDIPGNSVSFFFLLVTPLTFYLIGQCTQISQFYGFQQNSSPTSYPLPPQFKCNDLQIVPVPPRLCVTLNVRSTDTSQRIYLRGGPGSSVGIETELWAGQPGIEFRWGRDFPPVQTDPGAHPASCKMGTGSLPRVKCGRRRAADHSSPSSAAVMEEQSYTSTHPLGHTGPVTGSLYLVPYVKTSPSTSRYGEKHGAITEEYRILLLAFQHQQNRSCDLERPKRRWKHQKHLQDQKEHVQKGIRNKPLRACNGITLPLLLIPLHYDVRRDLVQTTYGIAIYTSYCTCLFSLKMAYKAGTYR